MAEKTLGQVAWSAYNGTLCRDAEESWQAVADAVVAAHESRLAEAERERDQLRALADTARDGMRQLGEDLEASRAEVERLRVVSSMPPDYVKNVIRASRGDRKKMREATARAEANEALVAGLRGALEKIAEMDWKCAATNAMGYRANKVAVAALALIPASAAARLKAEVE